MTTPPNNLQVAMRTMKVLDLLDQQINNVMEMMQTILADEGIICFHLHHDLLYHRDVPADEMQPYDDLINPDNNFKTASGQIIVLPGEMLRSGMLHPEEIKQLMNGQPPNPTNHPPPRKSRTYKLNITITAKVLQAMLDGFIEEKEKCISRLQEMGLDLDQLKK